MSESSEVDPLDLSFEVALRALQAELPVIGKATEGQVGTRAYKYAAMDVIWPKVQPLLDKYGFVWVCAPTVEADKFGLRYTLARHLTAQMMSTPFNQITGFYPLHEGKAQDQGSEITYARRYALCAVLGIIVAGEDDDGSKAQAGATERASRQTKAADAAPDEVAAHMAILTDVGSLTALQGAWADVQRAKLSKVPQLVELKDKRKAELS